MTTVTLELTPDMLERIECCREAGESLEDCALDLLWLGVLRYLRKRPDDAWAKAWPIAKAQQPAEQSDHSETDQTTP